MKFKIDENLPIEIADILVSSGHDALTVYNQQLAGGADPKLISVCSLEERVLITLDTHFANIRAYPPANLTGLIVLRLNRQDKPHVLEVMSRLVPVLSTEPIAGNLWIVEEKRIRIRK